MMTDTEKQALSHIRNLISVVANIHDDPEICWQLKDSCKVCENTMAAFEFLKQHEEDDELPPFANTGCFGRNDSKMLDIRNLQTLDAVSDIEIAQGVQRKGRITIARSERYPR